MGTALQTRNLEKITLHTPSGAKLMEPKPMEHVQFETIGPILPVHFKFPILHSLISDLIWFPFGLIYIFLGPTCSLFSPPCDFLLLFSLPTIFPTHDFSVSKTQVLLFTTLSIDFGQIFTNFCGFFSKWRILHSFGHFSTLISNLKVWMLKTFFPWIFFLWMKMCKTWSLSLIVVRNWYTKLG